MNRFKAFLMRAARLSQMTGYDWLRRENHCCSRACQAEHKAVHKTACKEAAALKKKKKKLAEEEDARIKEAALRKELAAAKKKEEEARSKAAREAVTNSPCPFCGMASFETFTATHYCSKACQVKHWPVHKIPCKESPTYKTKQELAALKKKNGGAEEKERGTRRYAWRGPSRSFYLKDSVLNVHNLIERDVRRPRRIYLRTPALSPSPRDEVRFSRWQQADGDG